GHEPGQPPLKGPPLDQHVPVAPPAAQPDVGAEPVDETVVSAAEMGAPQPQDVAEEQLDRGTRRHPAERIRQPGAQSRGWPWLGTRTRAEAGNVIRSVGWMSRAASGFVAASWATMPPARVSDPVSDSVAPIARIVKGSPSSVSSTEIAPGNPPMTVPVTTLTSSMAIASAPALWSSLMTSSTSGAPIGPRIVVVTQSQATRASPDQ